MTTDGVLKSVTAIASWLPPLLVGLSFTFMGSLKLFGVIRGIVGGQEKPLMTRLCGT